MGQRCTPMFDFPYETQFFCLTVESAQGEMKLLEKVMEGMNSELGGAGHLGKILFSSNEKKLVIMCHTPRDVFGLATAAEWMKPVLSATDAKIISRSKNLIQAELSHDPFHVGLRLGISASAEFLQSRGLAFYDGPRPREPL